MKQLFSVWLFLMVFPLCGGKEKPVRATLSKSVLADKIKGAWAGQSVAIAIAASADQPATGPSSLNVNGDLLGTRPLLQLLSAEPAQFDDVFLDVAFLETIEITGIKADGRDLAEQFARLQYTEGHAFQAARFNIDQGHSAPACGHWIRNPHADDVAFQKHADFIGLLYPAMPRSAEQLADRIGHITNYGDGYYAGLFVAQLYSMAFVNSSIESLIQSALESIPIRSDFFLCLTDVFSAYRRDSSDWKGALSLLRKQWPKSVACPDGMFGDFTMDARRNTAYVAMALLFGAGDLTRSLQIAHAASADSPFNLSTVAGILGAIKGFRDLPPRWQEEFESIGDQRLPYTNITLHEANLKSLSLALRNIGQHNGKVRANEVDIVVEKTKRVVLERSFEGHYPQERRPVERVELDSTFRFQFEGIGFLIQGEPKYRDELEEYTFEAEVWINDKFLDRMVLGYSGSCRKPHLYWQYQLAHKQYEVTIVPINPNPNNPIVVSELVLYDVRNE